MLNTRKKLQKPIRVGLIGAGKFGSMILSQARHIEGLIISAVADLNVEKAKDSFNRVGWDTSNCFATSINDAMVSGRTWITENAADIFKIPEIECIIEATGDPLFGVRHALIAIENTKHVIIVNVEADVLCGPYLNQKAIENNVVFSMAYGDQPAAICELVDWVRTNGFELAAAGKGMNFQPHYRYSTPDTVWDYFGWTKEEVSAGDFNSKMYNSFTDGTKAAIEMAAVANATGLDCPEDGLSFYPAGIHDLSSIFKPISNGGRLTKSGLVDIAASREPDGRNVYNNICYVMFVTFKAPNQYTRDCFHQYGLLTDETGWYASMWRPFHMIGLETNTSILSTVLRNEPTGSSIFWNGDAVATAKHDLSMGDILDGEGGYCVCAKAIPAKVSSRIRALPIGLAHNVKLKNPIKKDEIVSIDDVELLDVDDIISYRKNMETLLIED